MRNQRLRGLILDDSGSVTLYGVILFVVVLGVAGIVTDIGRLFDLHSQAENFVDQAALAAAAELDTNSGAIDRALRAAVGDAKSGPLIAGKQNFALGSADLSLGKVIFLETLGADPAPPGITPAAGDTVLYTCTVSAGVYSCTGSVVGGKTITKSDADLRAHFVAVETTSLTQQNMLLPVIDIVGKLFGASAATKQFIISPQATAGFTRTVCNIAPVMMCNPYEDPASPGTANYTPVVGQEMLVHEDTTPGGYGVLCPNGNTCRDLLAKRDPNTQCMSVQLPGKPGVTNGPVQDGFNVRFDMFSSPFNANNEGKDPEFAPAPNVTKGLKDCKSNATTKSMPFPDDHCFMDLDGGLQGTGCANFPNGVPHGDGSWSRDAYWTLNHNGTAHPASVDGTPWAQATRYQVYRYEIENNQQVSNSDEHGAPQCASVPPKTARKDDRRVLIMAITNCANPANNDKIIAFAKFFMVAPVNSPHDGSAGKVTVGGQSYQWHNYGNKPDLRLEMMGRVDPNAPDGVLHEDPVLYR